MTSRSMGSYCKQQNYNKNLQNYNCIKMDKAIDLG